MAVLLSGCASKYIPPTGRADFSAFTHSRINEGFAAAPTAKFPVGMAMVRVQESDYSSFSAPNGAGLYGSGRDSIFTTREVESDEQVDRARRLRGELLESAGGSRSSPAGDRVKDLREPRKRVREELAAGRGAGRPGRLIDRRRAFPAIP
jgi:hypothetical protein